MMLMDNLTEDILTGIMEERRVVQEIEILEMQEEKWKTKVLDEI
jgi:hypothetical protein